MNNTVMIRACLNNFISENGITLNESDAFELYTLYLLNKKTNLSAEDLLMAVVDGSSDGGIDTFLIMIDEFVINSDEEFESIIVKSDSTIKIVIGQSKFNSKFSEEIVNKFLISMDSVLNLEIDNDELTNIFNKQLVERIIWFRDLWRKAVVKGSRINIQFYYGCISNEVHERLTFKAKKEKVVEQAKTKVHNSIVSFDLYSAKELLALHSEKTEVHLELKFKEQPSTIDYKGSNIRYIGVVKLPDYYDFITDDHGIIRESHWRSFATSANFNLEHNRSVFNAGILPQNNKQLKTSKLNRIASFLAMTPHSTANLSEESLSKIL